MAISTVPVPGQESEHSYISGVRIVNIHVYLE